MIDLASIAPAFSFVVDKGLLPCACDYRTHDFGVAALVMQGASFSLRFEHDRGQIYVEAGSERTGWHRLEDVLEFVDGSLVGPRSLGESPDLCAMAGLLQSHWDSVAGLFGDRRRMSQLHSFARKKSVALLCSLSRKS